MSRYPYADPCLVCADDDRDCPRHIPPPARPWWPDLIHASFVGLVCSLAMIGALTVGQAVICAVHESEPLRYCDAPQVQR